MFDKTKKKIALTAINVRVVTEPISADSFSTGSRSLNLVDDPEKLREARTEILLALTSSSQAISSHNLASGESAR